ncbi:MAG: photosystem II protein Y [Moorea sp. SIO2I5]|nr:photosystem II protein Y [Moorena sp. SIO2I5]
MFTSLLDLIDLRWLIVFSPIVTAITWGMFIYEDSDSQDPWQF